MRIWFGLLIFVLGACGSDKNDSVKAEVLNFVNTSPPAGVVGDAYTFNLSARGGLQPYRYRLDGALPKGLTFSGNRISGVPTEKGNFKLRITLDDANLSSKFIEPVITIGDPTPPEFQLQLPQAETDQAFIFAARIKGRETGAVRATFQIKDLKPELESFQVPLGFISISRYDPQKGTLDFDGVFVQPAKDLEVFRLNMRPDLAIKPQTTVRQSLAFYDKGFKLFPQTTEVKREKSEGKYGFADLQAIAKNWKKAAKLEAPTPDPKSQGQTSKEAEATEQAKSEEKTTEEGKTAEAEQEAETTEQNKDAAEEEKEKAAESATTEAKTPAEESKTEPAKPEAPKEAEKSAEAAKEEPAKQGEAEKTAEAAKTEPAKTDAANQQAETKTPEEAKQPAQGQPTQPAQRQPDQPAKPDPTKLEGDLNNDLVVNEKDLEVLRSSYRWESVAGAATPNPTDPTKPNGPGGTPPRTPTEPGK